jgi:hypothetical protein
MPLKSFDLLAFHGYEGNYFCWRYGDWSFAMWKIQTTVIAFLFLEQLRMLLYNNLYKVGLRSSPRG